MGFILVLAELFLIVLTSRRTVAIAPTDSSEWGEKADVWRWNVEDFPNPQKHPKFCHRFAPSNICNPDSILTKEEADDLDDAIRRLHNVTSCLCPECSSSSGGIVFGIAVMKHIYLPYNEHKSATVRQFADDLREQWSLGECKNDIIIVLVTEDRLSSTSVGPGISSYISPRESKIFLDNKGYFTVGKYHEGLLSMVQAYYPLARSLTFEKDEEEVINAGLVAGIVVGVMLLVVLVILVGCTLRRRLSHPPSLRKESWDGDPSLSWKKTNYQLCNIQDFGEQGPKKHGDTENNNDRFINKSLQRGHIADKGNETLGQNETLLTTVAELEIEEISTTDGDSAEHQDLQNTNVNERNETELKYTEAEINSPAARTSYSGTVTNI